MTSATNVQEEKVASGIETTLMNFIQEIEMSLMCSMDGCKQKQGMCIHEKMMLGMVVVIAVGVVVWLL